MKSILLAEQDQRVHPNSDLLLFNLKTKDKVRIDIKELKIKIKFLINKKNQK